MLLPLLGAVSSVLAGLFSSPTCATPLPAPHRTAPLSLFRVTVAISLGMQLQSQSPSAVEFCTLFVVYVDAAIAICIAFYVIEVSLWECMSM